MTIDGYQLTVCGRMITRYVRSLNSGQAQQLHRLRGAGREDAAENYSNLSARQCPHPTGQDHDMYQRSARPRKPHQCAPPRRGLTRADLTGATWPEGARVPDGWMVDSDTGRLKRVAGYQR